MIHPDRNILTAALLLQAIATDVEKARRHLTAEIRLQDGTPTTTSGADSHTGRGERTIRVDEDCSGEIRCRWDDCPQADTRHTHPCPIEGEHTHPVGVPVTIVEAAAINRQHLEAMRDDLNACVNGAVTMANNINRTCQQILGTRFETPRCSATGRDGNIEWSQPGCTNVPARGPLCIPCYHRERRWRIAHGLPTREDTAA